MPSNTRPARFRRSVVLLLPLLAATCGGAADEPRVRVVEAKIDGITCESCVPPLKAALERQFGKGASIDVDDETDTATVRLTDDRTFTVAPFLEAAKQVRMRIMAFRLDVCGRLVAQESQRWLIAGKTRFLVTGDRELPLNQALCVEGQLDASREPLTLVVMNGDAQDDPKGATE